MKRFFILLPLFFFAVFLFAQKADTLVKNSLTTKTITALKKPTNHYSQLIGSSSHKSFYFNYNGAAVSVPDKLIKKDYSSDLFFLTCFFILLFLAVIKTLFNPYFYNLFRVFFNTSLRQSQLTDQLLQSKLPSLLYNIFFSFSFGIYVFLILRYFHLFHFGNFWIYLMFTVLFIAATYLGKYFVLKFAGWITGLKKITDTYLFVIFLVNKIIGILLIPFILVIAFSEPVIVHYAVVISLLVFGFMFLLRFFRSYSILQYDLAVSRFHFLIFIIGTEVIPVLFLYKILVKG